MGMHQHPRPTNLYGVYDGDTLVFEGNVHQVARHFGTTTNTIYSGCKNCRKFFRKYDIRVIGTYNYENDKMIPVHLSKEEEKEHYYFEHLRQYGNTVVRTEDNPKTIIKWLDEKGFRCDMKSYVHTVGDEILMEGRCELRKGSKMKDYILRWLDYDKQRVQSII